jgi:serine/threonine-protein kinase
LLLTGAILLVAPAWADASPTDIAAANVVFADAKKLVAEGRFNDACPKFEESQRLDPTPGTLLNLGDCYKQASPPRTASAWGAYQQAEVMARKRGDVPRQEAAAQRALEVEPVLSRVTISPTPAARIPGLELKWDGRPIGAGMWGTAVPVDSGEHTIEAGAPGKKSWMGKVLVRPNGGTMPVEIPGLEAAPLGVATPGEAALQPFWNTQRTVGLGIGGAGLVGVVVASIFGAKASGKNSDSLAHCRAADPTRCDSQGVALREDAYSAATVSTILFIVGGAMTGAGAVTFLTAPSGAPKIEPVVGVGVGGLTLRGSW